MSAPILVTAESQRVLSEADNLDTVGLHKDAGRGWRRQAMSSSAIEQTPAMLLAGSATRIELAQHDDNVDFEALLAGVRNTESDGR